LSGAQPATTAEELMRSRFTAHVARDWRYLHHTYRPTSRKPYVDEGDAAEIAWTRLSIHAHEPGATPDLAFVDFAAHYATEEGEQALHERSEFARIDGKWLYTRTVRNGPPPAKPAAPKVGRNEPCPCGSGKKFKHCCG
jgi:SEC-C motif-containing protein